MFSKNLSQYKELTELFFDSASSPLTVCAQSYIEQTEDVDVCGNEDCHPAELQIGW